MSPPAPPPDALREREEGLSFAPRFDEHGLLTAVVTDHASNAPLMVAHMDREALERTLRTGLAHFYSRSRQRLWQKGETSGNTLSVKEIVTDCDQDALWIRVEVNGDGAACHTGRRSCFYRLVEGAAEPRLVMKTAAAVPASGGGD